MSYLWLPCATAVAAVAAAVYVGGWSVALTVALLIVLEVSLSLDNAVVNAHVLEHWDEKWRKIFLGVGIIVAVFGMRLIFPLLIVSVTAGLPFWPWELGNSLDLALNNPDQYGKLLHEVHYLVAGFGGAFLMMVGLTYFLDAEKDTHWLGPIEGLLTKAGQIEAIQVGVTLLAVYLFSLHTPEDQGYGFLVAGLMGVLTYVCSKALGTIATGGQDIESKVIKAGIGGFLYLELLDASFSFDGVIGAFALTNNIIWIMVGLGVGALFVRELTIVAVDRGTLAEYKYLEHGAFWAIISLALIMMLSPIIAIPEWITGLLGAFFIGAAFISSLLVAKETAT